jgi:hypothetical protein
MDMSTVRGGHNGVLVGFIREVQGHEWLKSVIRRYVSENAVSVGKRLIY